MNILVFIRIATACVITWLNTSRSSNWQKNIFQMKFEKKKKRVIIIWRNLSGFSGIIIESLNYASLFDLNLLRENDVKLLIIDICR